MALPESYEVPDSPSDHDHSWRESTSQKLDFLEKNNGKSVQYWPLQPIAAYLCLYWDILNKLQGKAVAHSEKLEWWIILMVDCVTILLVEIEQNGYTIHN